MSVPLYRLPEQQPSVWQPTSVEEAMHLKHKWGDDAVLVSGGTWLRTRWENGVSSLPQHLISLARIQALSGLAMDAGGLIHIGPALRLADLMDNELMHTKCGLLVQACAEIAAPSVRNLASIGGNVVTRTGDLIAALLVMDAQVVCSDGAYERTLALQEWLGTSAQLRPEVMIDIILPAADTADAGSTFEFYAKVGRREAFTPSVVTVAGKLTLAPDQTIKSMAIAVGGGSAVPARFAELEDAAIGQPISKKLLQSLHAGVSEGFHAVPDDYAGVAYRKQTAANLIVSECYKIWRKGGGTNAPES